MDQHNAPRVSEYILVYMLGGTKFQYYKPNQNQDQNPPKSTYLQTWNGIHWKEAKNEEYIYDM